MSEYDKLKPAAILYSIMLAVSDIRGLLERKQKASWNLAVPLWAIAVILAAGLCLAAWILLR